MSYWAISCVRPVHTLVEDIEMQSKLVMIVVLGVGAAALGGVYLIGGDKAPPAQPNEPDQIASSAWMDQYDSSFSNNSMLDESVEQAPRSGAGQSGFGWDDFASRMTEFDADGDGILSSEERDAMRRAMRDQMMAGLDLDGDGEISREERMAAMRDRFEQSPRGQELMRQFDLDGDGKLNEEEQAAMDAYNQEQRDIRRQEQLTQYDLDGDGELSRDERQAQREDQRSQRDNFMQGMNDEFDRDGDGQLSIEESQDAMSTMRERREIDQFISRYDVDGDGRMTATDYDAFVSNYSSGNMAADVNRDGVINSQDLSAYTDLVTRSRNRP